MLYFLKHFSFTADVKGSLSVCTVKACNVMQINGILLLFLDIKYTLYKCNKCIKCEFIQGQDVSSQLRLC